MITIKKTRLRDEIEENHVLIQYIYNQDKEIITETTNTQSNRLIRGSQLIASSGEHDKTYYHYVRDEMGSTTHILDEAGEILNQYSYDAFGNLTEEKETIPNRFKYAGQQLDPKEVILW